MLLRALFFVCLFAARPVSAGQCDFIERYEKRDEKIVFIKRGVGLKTVAVEVDGIDPKNFKEILPPPILNADGRATFCNRVYATDGRYVYYRGDKMARVKPSDFKVLAGGYARTSTDLYWADIPIPGAYLENFKVIGWGKARDGKFNYSEHQRR